jgi:hypothetical protein
MEEESLYGALGKLKEKHTADSKWQYCNCGTCQEKRNTLNNLPGPPIDYDKLRRKDEHY